MGVSKILVASVVLLSLLALVWADAEVEDASVVEAQKAVDGAIKLEVEQLRSKIANLENTVLNQNNELKSKDVSIALLEKIIKDKEGAIALLQSEIKSVQKKGSVDTQKLVTEARGRVADLEKQVENFRNDIELENKKKDASEHRACEAEKNLEEINLRIKSLQKTNDEQKRKIKKIERALQVAEEELMRVQLEATAKSKNLTRVHGSWLPPWLATHIRYYQEVTSTYWEKHGKPILNVFIEQVSEKSAQAQKWLEPHVIRAYTEWLPVIRERWTIFLTNVEPIAKRVQTSTLDAYDASKKNLAPHLLKVQELADPYFQEAKRLSKPYIHQFASVTEPHVEKLQVILKPYKDHAIHAYGKFLKSARTYHHQVQAGIHEHLKKHELTKSLATKELVWFMASAFLALPIFLVYRLVSDIFCSKSKPTRHSHANHGHHRRHKRRHADK